MKRKAIRLRKIPTAAESAAWKTRLAAAEAEKPAILRRAREVFAADAALKESVAAELQAARASADLTLSELTDRTGISEGRLSRLLAGQCNPTVQTLGRIAVACGRKVVLTLEPTK